MSIFKGPDYIAVHTDWQCDRAKTIKSVLGDDSGILVTTGGESYLVCRPANAALSGVAHTWRDLVGIGPVCLAFL
jgi:hypothetical protein